jgi:hypothetical protein
MMQPFPRGPIFFEDFAGQRIYADDTIKPVAGRSRQSCARFPQAGNCALADIEDSGQFAIGESQLLFEVRDKSPGNPFPNDAVAVVKADLRGIEDVGDLGCGANKPFPGYAICLYFNCLMSACQAGRPCPWGMDRGGEERVPARRAQRAPQSHVHSMGKEDLSLFGLFQRKCMDTPAQRWELRRSTAKTENVLLPSACCPRLPCRKGSAKFPEIQ